MFISLFELIKTDQDSVMLFLKKFGYWAEGIFAIWLWKNEGGKNIEQMKIDGCMTENCQNYLSLEVVPNEKSFRASLS